MLYQLSYASPEAAVSFIVKPPSHPEDSGGRRPTVRAHSQSHTHHGTVSKVTTRSPTEQTGAISERNEPLASGDPRFTKTCPLERFGFMPGNLHFESSRVWEIMLMLQGLSFISPNRSLRERASELSLDTKAWTSN
jgi:hypothetical protein